ncbi:MAG TPA: ricin-type beta-trefoil lectin domain protein [Trebonia sp.]
MTSTPAAAGTPQVNGTDVYQNTNVTSWPNVAAGNAFVGIEAVQGLHITNTNYNSQVTGAAAAGLYVMPYVFADPALISGSAEFTRAWNVISQVPGVPYTSGGKMLPIALDMESDPINFPGEPCYGVSPSAMVSWISAFVSADKSQTGVAPIIYSSPSWWSTCIGNTTTTFGSEPLWIADYGVSSPAILPGWSSYTFWQNSDSGTVSGISGSADTDLLRVPPATVTAKAGSSGSVQVQTLNALAGQSVSYTATGLGTGMSLNPTTGVFQWTSATPAGSYPITITPSASSAVVPSTVTFTLNVHGSIALSVSNRTSTAGTPVSLRVPASDPDTGYTPTLTASGLPPGMSMNSSGLITGWPYAPGSYTVKVSASDGLGGTGSAAFTWTVGAAADSGTTGQIRQSGGTGKCLEDLGSKTANGSPIVLWTCGSGTNQKWTTVQDGTIRVLGKCLDMAGLGTAANTALQLWTCNSGDGAQQWQAASDGELLNPRSGKCIYVPTDSAGNGTKPVAHACANDTRHHWLRPAAPVVSGLPGRCLATSGTAAELVNCANVATQHWTAEPNGTIAQSGKCLTEGGTTAGSAVSFGSCSGSAAQWTLISAGRIAVELSNPASHLCVSVPANSTASGTALKMEACGNNPYSTWGVE